MNLRFGRFFILAMILLEFSSHSMASSSCQINIWSREKKVQYLAAENDGSYRLTRISNGIREEKDFPRDNFNLLKKRIKEITFEQKNSPSCKDSAQVTMSCDTLKEASTCLGAKENKKMIYLSNSLKLYFNK